MAIVFVFARVASYFSDTGGPVTYATQAFGPFVGFQAGWLMTLSRAAAFAANAHLMVTYAGWFWEPLGDGTAHLAAVGLVCVVLTAINIIGIRQGMIAIFALTVLKLLPLVLLVFLGISQTNPEIFTGADIPPLSSLGDTMLIVFYAFVGFESAVVPAGEARNAKRDIPVALVRTILAITVFYFLIQIVTISVAPDVISSKNATGRCGHDPVGNCWRCHPDAWRCFLDHRQPHIQHAVRPPDALRHGSAGQPSGLVWAHSSHASRHPRMPFYFMQVFP